jgi:hypothetical protein
MAKELTCAFNLRKFPRELRESLRHFALDANEDIQDFVPRWLSERLEQEERKTQSQSKKIAKQK